MPEHLTDEFLLIQPQATSPVEFWMDWHPVVDGDPALELGAWREGDDLLVQSLHDDQARPTRRLPALDAQVWSAVHQCGGHLVLCGPSGVLSTRFFKIDG